MDTAVLATSSGTFRALWPVWFGKDGNSNIASRCVRVGLVLRIAALVLLALPSSLAADPRVHPVLQTQHRCCLRKGAPGKPAVFERRWTPSAGFTAGMFQFSGTPGPTALPCVWLFPQSGPGMPMYHCVSTLELQVWSGLNQEELHRDIETQFWEL